MTTLAARLRQIEKKLSPARRKKPPRNPHESLEQIKAILELVTNRDDWTIYTTEEGTSTLYCAPKGAQIMNSGTPFISIYLYNGDWPATVRLATPRQKNTSEMYLTGSMGDMFEYSQAIAHDSKELDKLLGDHLDTPAVLDWFKVKV